MIIKDKELKEDYKIIKEYFNMKYPKYTHTLELDLSFDSINGLCSRFLSNHKKYLGFELIGLDENEIYKINELSFFNSDDKEIKYLLEYCERTNQAVKILGKYYNLDGTVKIISV